MAVDVIDKGDEVAELPDSDEVAGARSAELHPGLGA